METLTLIYLDTLNGAKAISAEPAIKSPTIPFHLGTERFLFNDTQSVIGCSFLITFFPSRFLIFIGRTRIGVPEVRTLLRLVH